MAEGHVGVSWHQIACATIAKVEEAARAEGVTDPGEILRRVDAAYPFGPRKYFPYKMWLKARKALRVRLGLGPGPDPKTSTLGSCCSVAAVSEERYHLPLCPGRGTSSNP